MNINLIAIQPVNGLTAAQFAAEPLDTLHYVTSVRALAEGRVRVTKINTEGSVNHLRIQNLSDQFAFFLDGDILVGAKQNRVLNTSLFLAPHTVTFVPVSCIEQGRWRFSQAHFESAPCAAPPSLRALKSQDLGARARASLNDHWANQGKVWHYVAHLAQMHDVQSPTGNLTDVFAAKQATMDRALAALRHAPGANGLALWAGDRLISVDIFNRADALGDYLPRLVRGALLDFVHQVTPPPPPSRAAATDRLATVICEALAHATPPRPSVGVGSERRFETADTLGLALDYQDQLVHLGLTARAI
ncbi:MAG: hypothetical protein IPM17_05170 [Verrucomicrobia bacterium]|nr:hypothetical protein [Verrucomicrobiota bacterium]